LPSICTMQKGLSFLKKREALLHGTDAWQLLSLARHPFLLREGAGG
jgi:hypothetical protein